MNSLTTAQRGFLLLCVIGWVAFAFYAPENVSVDAYFFRDAACNWVQGGGFRTASLEKSVSFTPVLYSSYPPLSQWVFLLFAKVFGCTWQAANVHSIVLTTLGNLFVLMAGLRVARTAVQRWLLVLLVGVTLPLGFLLTEVERPEQLTFLLLAALLWLLGHRRQTVGTYVAEGLLAGLAFLSEPFGGVFAVLAIAGAALGQLLPPSVGEPGRSSSHRFHGAVSQGVIGAVFFALPLGLTVAAFQHQDPTALARFERHARLAGTDRALDYSMSADTNEKEAREPRASFGTKLHASIAAQVSKGPIFKLQIVGFLLTGLLGVLLALTGRPQDTWPVWGMLLLGLVLPILAFPMQENYHTLGEAAVPLALGLGWAGYRAVTSRQRWLLWSIFAVQLLCLLPDSVLHFVLRVDTRPSALFAVRQAQSVGDYLRSHGLGNTILMVPTADYYFYKPAYNRLYNPNYYSVREGMDQVGGVVTCKTSSLDFSGTPVPPQFPGEWKLIAGGGPGVAVAVGHHQLMHRNWSNGCSVYVRAQAPCDHP